ncbi:MAG: tetratricopeptide repeat protein [Gemmatimonadales bacterium]
MRKKLPLDWDAGFVVAAFGVLYAALVGLVRGLSTGRISATALAILIAAFGIVGVTVGSVVAGRPDFGPTRRAALLRGFVALIPLYGSGGLVFLPPERWFTLLPVLSLAVAALVGPPIGIFMYRLHRRVDAADRAVDTGIHLAWLKGELLGGWTPLLVSIGLLAAFGIGIRAIPDEMLGPPRDSGYANLADKLPALYRAVEADTTSARVHYELGSVLTVVGRFSESVDQLKIAVALDSTNAEYWRMLGRATFFARVPDQSLEAYWNVQRLDPSSLGGRGLDRVIWEAVLAERQSSTKQF